MEDQGHRVSNPHIELLQARGKASCLAAGIEADLAGCGWADRVDEPLCSSAQLPNLYAAVCVRCGHLETLLQPALQC